MYDNPEWTVNGSIIIVIGVIVMAIGGFIFVRHRTSPTYTTG
jgi:hypothetical protein